MPVAPHAGAGEDAGVDQRGVVETIGDDERVAPRERGDETEVGHVAGREQERPRCTGEFRETLFEFAVHRHVPGNEMRGPRPDAAAGDAARHGLGQPRVGGETQVVVGAEVDPRAGGRGDHRPLGRGQLDALAVEILRVPAGEALGEFRQEAHPAWPPPAVVAPFMPRRPSSCWSCSTPALSVVSSLSP